VTARTPRLELALSALAQAVALTALVRWQVEETTSAGTVVVDPGARSRLGPWPAVLGMAGAIGLRALSRGLLVALPEPAGLPAVFALQLAGAGALWAWNERVLRSAAPPAS
jgi:hypothetical protein